MRVLEKQKVKKTGMLLLSVLAMLGLSSCNRWLLPNAPKGEMCLINSSTSRLDCYNSDTELFYTKEFSEADKYIAKPNDYDEKLLSWCKEGWRKADEKKVSNDN